MMSRIPNSYPYYIASLAVVAVVVLVLVLVGGGGSRELSELILQPHDRNQKSNRGEHQVAAPGFGVNNWSR